MSRDDGVMVRVRPDVRARLAQLATRYRTRYGEMGWLPPWWRSEDGPTMGELVERLIQLDLNRLERGNRKRRRAAVRIEWHPDDIVTIAQLAEAEGGTRNGKGVGP